MSTRSRIGIIRARSGEEFPHPRQVTVSGPDYVTGLKDVPVVESIYCHFDGYPEGVGQTLLDHWTTLAKVNRLIKLGDLSSLGSEIGKKHDFDTHLPDYWGTRDQYEHLPEDEQTAFRLKLEAESASGKGWCLAYRRDRGEKDCGSRTHLIDDWPDYGQEAEYLFDPETCEWRIRRQDFNPVGWNTVTPWEGWIDIPAAIALNTQEMDEVPA